MAHTAQSVPAGRVALVDRPVATRLPHQRPGRQAGGRHSPVEAQRWSPSGFGAAHGSPWHPAECSGAEFLPREFLPHRLRSLRPPRPSTAPILSTITMRIPLFFVRLYEIEDGSGVVTLAHARTERKGARKFLPLSHRFVELASSEALCAVRATPGEFLGRRFAITYPCLCGLVRLARFRITRARYRALERTVTATPCGCAHRHVAQPDCPGPVLDTSTCCR